MRDSVTPARVLSSLRHGPFFFVPLRSDARPSDGQMVEVGRVEGEREKLAKAKLLSMGAA